MANSFFAELKRRNVFRVGVAYLATSWLLMEVADFLLSKFGYDDSIIRLVIIILAIGLIPVLIFSWIYEYTSDGFIKESKIDRSKVTTIHISQKLDYLIIGLLVIGMGYFIWESRFEEVSSSQTTSTSLAVLPFVNMSSDPEQEYFSDGLTEELLDKLAHIHNLRVPGRTSSFTFKGKTNVDVKTIGDKLNVAYVLEGSVRKSGDNLRIVAQLINAKTDTHMWSKTYDRKLSIRNIFAIQAEIATLVAKQLQIIFTPGERIKIQKKPTDNLAAYTAYLRGRALLARRTSDASADAVGYFEHAIQLDPDYSLAHIGLADAYYNLSKLSTLTNKEYIIKATPIIKRALELNDQFGEAYVSLGNLRWAEGDIIGADIAFSHAIELSPNNAQAYTRYGYFLGDALQRKDDALDYHNKSVKIDPLSTIANMALAQILLELDRYNEALAQCESIIRFDPEFPRAYTLLADLHWQVYGNIDKAIPLLHKSVELDPGNPRQVRWLGMAYLDLGLNKQARQWLQRSIDMSPNKWFADWTKIFMYLHLGGDLRSVTQSILEKYPNMQIALRVLRDLDIAEGRSATEALSRYRNAFPQMFVQDPDITASTYFLAIDISYVLLQTGNNAQAEAMLDKSLAVIETQSRLGYDGYAIADVDIYALQGKTDVALASLQKAIDQGWRSIWQLNTKHNRHLEGIRFLSKYQYLIKKIEKDLQQQRNQLSKS